MSTQFFVVKGIGRFPIDMLRYDSAYPRTSEDATKIENSLTGDLRKWEISLCSESQFAPCVDRWKSFLTKVIEINGRDQT
jgi:hypothetical protein